MKLVNAFRKTRFRWSYIFVPAILIAAAFILPPIIRALVSLAKGGKSVADGAKDILDAAGEGLKSIANIFGVGSWEGKDVSNEALNPAANLFWNLNFWKGMGNSYPSVNEIKNVDIIVKELHDLYHWYGFTETEIIAYLQSVDVLSQQAFSYVNYVFHFQYGETLPEYWLKGYWLRMSDKRFKQIDSFGKSLPAVF